MAQTLPVVTRARDLWEWQWKDFRAYAPAADGVTDDRAKLNSAFTDLLAAGGGVLFIPKGRYKISKYVLLSGLADVTVVGESGATIVYPSADTSITSDGTAPTSTHARAGLLIMDCSRVTVRGLIFEGSTSKVLDNNTGPGIYVRNTTDARILNCTQFYGATLLQQDTQAADQGVLVEGNTIYGCTRYMSIAGDARIIGNRWEQPTDAAYDRIDNENGTSHGIYLTAGTNGRRSITIANNSFRGIREACVKASATAVAVRSITVTGNTFDDCAYACEFGADDRNEHSSLVFADNVLLNCGTNRLGWVGHGVSILGSRSVIIRGNSFYYTRDAVAGSAGRNGIQVSRYVATISTALDAAMTAGDNLLTIPSAPFGSSVAGKQVLVNGAGAGNRPLNAIITKYLTTSTVRLSLPAVTTVSGVFAQIGTGSPIEQVLIEGNSFQALLARTVTDAVIEAGSPNLTSVQAWPTNDDIGSVITVAGAGVAGGTLTTTILDVTTIATVLTIVLATNASTTVSGASATFGGATNPNSVLQNVINVSRVGQDVDTQGQVAIRNNQIGNLGSVAIMTNLNLGLVIEGNQINNAVLAMALSGDRMPVVRNNQITPGSATGTAAQLRLTDVTWPVIYGNMGTGRLATQAGGTLGIAGNAGGSTRVDYPLRGKIGRCLPSEGKPEVVLGYGSGWVDGDRVNVSGTFYTYKTTITDALTQFNSFATLLALLDVHPNTDAADYGAPWGITTQHIRIRRSAASLTANLFYLEVHTARRTAGVILPNGNVSNPMRCNSRGEGTDGGGGVPVGTRSVVWSPLAHVAASVNFMADNETGAALLGGASAALLSELRAPYVVNRSGDDGGSCQVVAHLTAAGTEQFRWGID